MRRLFCVLVAVSLFGCASPTGVAPDTADDRSGTNRGAQEPRRVTAPVLPVNPEHALGSSTAPLAIVEFTDYQCPYCRAFHVGTFAKLRSAYIDTGKVRYYFKDFPLRTHKHAFAASVVAYCAGAQGRFWEMQDLLYANQARLGDELFDVVAGELKLDATQFSTCRRSQAAQAAVRRDVDHGRRIRVTGTPSFVLGRVDGDGVMVERMATGAPTFEVFARELDALSR
jgi:protein-disulfide isomerase